MIAAVVTLAVCLAASIATNAFLGRWFKQAKDEAGLAGDRLREQARIADEREASLVKERDELTAKLDVATRQLAVAKVRLTTAETQRNTANREVTNAVVQRIRESNATTAAGVLNDLLAKPIPSKKDQT